MNERIRELAKEAGLWRQHYDIGEESPARLEKFAELIVKECADIQMKRSCERHGYDKYEDAKEIKEHFGVES